MSATVRIYNGNCYLWFHRSVMAKLSQEINKWGRYLWWVPAYEPTISLTAHFWIFHILSHSYRWTHEYVTCNTRHPTIPEPFRHVPAISDQDCVRPTIVRFYHIGISPYRLIVAKTQDREASLKFYQLICSLPSSPACQHIKTAKLHQHCHIGISSTSVPWSYHNVMWLRHVTKMVILLFNSVHASQDIKFTW